MDPLTAQLIAQNGTLFRGQGVGPRFPGFGVEIPGMNQTANMGMNMALQALLSQMIGPGGPMALQFGGGVNLFDTMQARGLFAQQQQAMQQASVVDQMALRNIIAGAARLSADVDVRDPRVAASIGNLAGTMSGMLPGLAMLAPESIDRMLGLRGSSTIMTQNIMRGAQFMIDPITGAPGMSGETAGRMNERIFKTLYGPDVSTLDVMRNMRGLGAGDAGAMFEEMSRRGLIGGSARDTGPGGEQRYTDKITQSLKGMAGTVSAMRDIFGDLGRPDAPMREIFDGLQALTQGSMAQMDPARLEMMVRKTQQIARATGLGIEGMIQVTARGAALADQFGLDRQFAVTAAQDAAMYAQSMGGTGFATVRAFGMPDKDTLLARATQLNVAATASPVANQLGAIMALNAQRPFAAGSDMAAIMDAISKNQTEVTLPGQAPRSLASFTPAELATMAGDRGAAFMVQLEAGKVNQQYIAAGNLGGLTRRMQRYDIMNTLAASARRGGLGDMSSQFAEAFFAITPEEMAKDANGYAAIRQRLMAANPNMSAKEIKDMENALSITMGNVGQLFNEGKDFANFPSFLGLRTAFDPGMFARAAEIDRTMGLRGQMAGVLGGIGRGGITRNLADFLMTAPAGATLAQFVTTLAGGVGGKDVQKLLLGMQNELTPLFTEFMDEKTPADRRAKILTEMTEKLGATDTELLKSSLTPEQRTAMTENINKFSKFGFGATGLQKLGKMGIDLKDKTGAQISEILQDAAFTGALSEEELKTLGSMDTKQLGELMKNLQQTSDATEPAGTRKDKPLFVRVVEDDTKKAPPPGNRNIVI